MVIAIIVALIGAILVAGTTFVNTAKAKNTKVLLTMVRDAVDQFSAEQERGGRLVNAQYRARYGTFPPDEIEIFTPFGQPTQGGGSGASRGAGGAVIVPGAGAAGMPPGPMSGYSKGLAVELQAQEWRDQTALICAIEMFSEAGSVLLDKIPDRNRTNGLTTPAGVAVLFLDRGPMINNTWNPAEDLLIKQIIDDWGTPIGYMTQRGFNPAMPNASVPSSNHVMAWNRASSQMVAMNSGQPVIFSYGPDGRDQCTMDAMGQNGAANATMYVDWMTNNRLANPLNQDNLFAHEGLGERLIRGLP